MARPTNDPKGRLIQVRINDETRAYIEREARASGIGMSEYVRNVLNGKINIENPLIADIITTIELQGEDADEFFRILNKKLNNYEITFEDGEISVNTA